MMKDILCNDKFLVTFAVTVLGVLYIVYGWLTLFSPENVITAIVSGLFGMAAGRGMARAEDRNQPEIKK
jgi:ATP-dependent protease HslVU (ClpYQ) peptidase subunit